METLGLEPLDRLFGLVEGVPGRLGLPLPVVYPAERRLEPLRRGLALFVLSLRLLQALFRCWELLVPGWLGQLASPLV